MVMGPEKTEKGCGKVKDPLASEGGQITPLVALRARVR